MVTRQKLSQVMRRLSINKLVNVYVVSKGKKVSFSSMTFIISPNTEFI